MLRPIGTRRRMNRSIAVRAAQPPSSTLPANMLAISGVPIAIAGAYLVMRSVVAADGSLVTDAAGALVVVP